MKLFSQLFALASILFVPCLSHAEFKLCEFAGIYTGYSSSAGGLQNALANSGGILFDAASHWSRSNSYRECSISEVFA